MKKDWLKHYQKIDKIEFNNQVFQILLREDQKLGFLKIVNYGSKQEFVYPTAQEFLQLSSLLNVGNRIKF